MNIAEVLSALALPPESRVDQRVPKKLLVENGAPTAADKRQINEGIEELLWLAALKPNTIGVPEFRDPQREYLEIAVLSLTLRPVAKPGRLTELVHRAIPYPVLLLAQQTDRVTLSLAHKRRSQGEAGKVVLDDQLVECELTPDVAVPQFLSHMAVAGQPRANLLTFYQGWLDCLRTYQAACITGRFEPRTGDDAAAARRAALAQYDRLTGQIAGLRCQAERELQVHRRVELNLEITRLKESLTKLHDHL